MVVSVASSYLGSVELHESFVRVKPKGIGKKPHDLPLANIQRAYIGEASGGMLSFNPYIQFVTSSAEVVGGSNWERSGNPNVMTFNPKDGEAFRRFADDVERLKSQLQATQVARYCRACGAALIAGDAFCAACGAPTGSIEASTPISSPAPDSSIPVGSDTAKSGSLSGGQKGCLVLVAIFLGLCAWGWIIQKTDPTPTINMSGTITIMGYGNSISNGGQCSGSGTFKNLAPGKSFIVKGDGKHIESGWIRNSVYLQPGVCVLTFDAKIKESDSYEFKVSGLQSITQRRSSIDRVGDTLQPELVWGY